MQMNICRLLTNFETKYPKYLHQHGMNKFLIIYRNVLRRDYEAVRDPHPNIYSSRNSPRAILNSN